MQTDLDSAHVDLASAGASAREPHANAALPRTTDLEAQSPREDHRHQADCRGSRLPLQVGLALEPTCVIREGSLRVPHQTQQAAHFA